MESIHYENGYKLSIVVDNKETTTGFKVESITKNYIAISSSEAKFNGKTVKVVLTPKI